MHTNYAWKSHAYKQAIMWCWSMTHQQDQAIIIITEPLAIVCNLLSTSSLFISTQHTWLYSTAKYRIGFLAWFYKMECIWKYCHIIITISKACCSRQSIKDTEAFFSGKVPRQVCNVFYFTWVCSALTKIRKIKTLAIVLKNTAIIQYITIKKKLLKTCVSTYTET